MKPLSVAFLWHMHQPMYKDPVGHKSLMPWVRLHSLKGYNDMVRILADYPHMRQNFNLVPSLLVQIQDTLKHPENDVCWAVSAKPVADLTPEDKQFLMENFFMANWDTMVKPYPRYWHLLAKRGYEISDQPDTGLFSEQEYLDLQVYFNLVWFGYMARKQNPLLGDLLKKGEGFKEEEKKAVLDVQLKIMRELQDQYRSAQDRGQIEISVSPFYHPILPLLMDTDFTRRAMPWAPVPDRFVHPEDAVAQISKALDEAQKAFGKRPQGMWPSEGSVCEELMELLADAGVGWIATDEQILLNSLHVGDRGHALYVPYRAWHKDKSVAVVFRDHSLSDLIGFVYRSNPSAHSAADLLGHLSNIRKHLEGASDGRLVSIILDGENPWEYYPDGGEGFLRTLYEKMEKEAGLQSTTIGDFLAQHPPQHKIDHLYSGSWINHSFDIWIGSEEENTAWNLLKKTRDFLAEHSKRNPGIGKGKLAAAWEEIYMAEGSDWFWWYGDDFSSQNDALFDELFRMHLANVYRILGQDVPTALNIPIAKPEPTSAMTHPVGFISPILDGKVTHFFEWHEGGHLKVARTASTMKRAAEIFQNLHYGFDLHHLYLRLDLIEFEKIKRREGLQGVVHVATPGEYKIVFPLEGKTKQRQYELFSVGGQGQDFKKIKQSSSMAVDKVMEMSISFGDLGARKGDEVQFFVEICEGKIQLDRAPRDGVISLQVPDEEFESEMWSV